MQASNDSCSLESSCHFVNRALLVGNPLLWARHESIFEPDGEEWILYNLHHASSDPN